MNNLLTKKDGYTLFAVAALANFAAVILQWALLGWDSGFAYWTKVCVYSLMLGACLPVYCKLTKKDFIKVAKFDKKPMLFDTVAICVIVFVALNFLTVVNNWFIQGITDLGFTTPSVDVPLDNVACLVVFVCIIPALCEETLFRGGIANALSGQNKMFAVFVSGALFSLFHMNPAQTIPQFVLGCLFALAYFCSGSIYTAIIAHFFSNLAVVVLALTVEQTGFYEKYALTIFLIGITLFAVLLFAYLYVSKKRTSEKNFQIDAEASVQETEKLPISQLLYFLLAVAYAVACWLAVLFYSEV